MGTNNQQTYKEKPQTFDELADMVYEMRNALLGDRYGNSGYIQRISNLEQETTYVRDLIRQNRKIIDRMWYYAAGAGIIIAAIFEFTTRLLDKLL